MIGSIHGEQPGVLKCGMIFFQNSVEPFFILFGNGKIVLNQFPIGYNGDREKLLPHLNTGISCAGRHFLGVGEYGEITVGF